jgi:chromosome segregation ATPase
LKALPILNAVGCFFLVGFIVFQWNEGQKLEKDLRAARLAERNAQNEKVEVEQRAYQLQVDVDTLKGSIESMKAEAELVKKKTAEDALHLNLLHTGLAFNQAYFTAMDQAIAERNARISELNSALAAARQRLDAAIAELKKAGAR